MSDPIDRQSAIEAIEQMQMPIMRSEFPEEQFVFTGMSEALQAIKDLPSAQPVIIRCKDCKYYRPMIDQDDLCVYREMQVFPNDYCSRAERREDG